jgi:hypothetical protein
MNDFTQCILIYDQRFIKCCTDDDGLFLSISSGPKLGESFMLKPWKELRMKGSIEYGDINANAKIDQS